ncbi:MAG TPA: nickel pincer cofactor biosynthesis protein LarC [Candidatus Deferrimicrobiaceae bacterium]|nr:nickel pincer cofactor biosynthesis protein LarC [Candidatus Deferrimicrobiaceae bacterium]
MTRFSKIVVIDAQVAGVAGDMVLGALLDLGADEKKVTLAIKSLEGDKFGYKNISIDIQKVMRKGFCATKIDITAEGKNPKDGKALIRIVEEAAKNLKLSAKAQQYASNVIHTLVETEAKLHGHHLPDAHLHEVGLVDTAAEIIGSAVALEDLDLFEANIVATPVAVGGGTFQFSHGTVSAPSPAALAILQSHHFPFRGGPVESELATPTGASIIVNLASEVSRFYPEMAPLKVGYGAGGKEFPEIANLLRITVGESLSEGLLEDQIAVIETNVDDVPGEIIGYSVEQLLAEGAKDVSIIPMYTKKNRPGQIIKVIADQKDAQHLSRILIAETGTLGVRVYFCERHIVNRESHSVEVVVNGVKEPIKVKISKDAKGEVVRIKPEFDDLKRLAEKTHKPLRELSELALAKAREVFNPNM